MKSWWDMTKEEQDARMAIEPLSMGAVSEAFRHPASYAELRLVQTIWKYTAEANKAEKRAKDLEVERDGYRSALCDLLAAANGTDIAQVAIEKARAVCKDGPPTPTSGGKQGGGA